MQHQLSYIVSTRIGIRLLIGSSLLVYIAAAQAQPTTIARLDLTPQPNQPNTRPVLRSILKIGNLKNYRHPNNLFAIDIPQKWQVEDRSKPNHTILIWRDSNNEGLIEVQVRQSSRQLTEEELSEGLSAIIKRGYASYPQSNINIPVTQSDGSVRVTWSYPKKLSDGSMMFFTGNSFIQQHGNKVSVNYYILPSQQYGQ
jgi:hypothetical protein